METTQKVKLIGAVISSSQLFTADRVQLHKPFSRKKTVCWMFCSRCNEYLETDLSFARWLLEEANILVPDNWEGYYLETQNVCRTCRNGKQLIIKLKKI